MEDPGTSAQNVAKMDGGSAHIEILHMATLDHLAPSPPHYSSAKTFYHDSFVDYDHRSRSPTRRPYDDDRRHRRHRPRHTSRSRSQSPSALSYSSSHKSSRHHVSWNEHTPSTPVASLSLLDSINVFLDDG
jgi:hypothetical protein